MDLEALRLLMRVVESGSVQSAAHQIGMSRSSLRRKLDNLEAEVGAELFVRSPAGVELTAAGAVVLAEGRAVLERVTRLVSSAKSATGDVAGSIKVVVPVGMPDAVRTALLRVLHSIAPELCLVELERPEPLDHLHEPFALMFHFGEPPERGEWFSRVISRVSLVPLASEAYFEEKGRPAAVNDLANHRLISWHVGASNPMEWPLRSGGTFPIRPMFSSRNGQLAHRAAQEGVGVVLGNPDRALHPLAVPLVPVLAAEIERTVTFRCLSPVPGNVDARARAVLESIHAVLEGLGAAAG